MRTTGILLLVLSLMVLAFLPEAKAGASHTSLIPIQAGYTLNFDTQAILATSAEQVLLSEGVLTVEEQAFFILQPKHTFIQHFQLVTVSKAAGHYSGPKGFSAASFRDYQPKGP